MELPYNIATLLLDKNLLENRANKPAVVHGDHSVSYQALFYLVQSFSEYFQSIALPKGSIVACLFEDSIESVVVFLSLIRMGLVPCFINPRLNENDYDFYIKHCNAVYGLCLQKEVQRFSPAFERSRISLKVVDDIILLNNLCPGNVKNIKELLDLGSDIRAAFCLYTSGTTGRPSAVVHRHKDIAVTCQNYVKNILNVCENDILFSTSKLFFAYGLNSLCYALYCGATAILVPEKTDPECIWNVINIHKPTIFFSVPAQYYRLLKFTPLDMKLESLRICVSAGEHLPLEIRKEWKKVVSKSIIDGIGTTEILSTFISNRQDEDHDGATGKVVPGFEISIRNNDQCEVEVNQVGVLWVRGDTYNDWYINHPEATQQRFVNGWFNTGDLFSNDSEGNFYYHGRANDLIKSGAQWIYPYRIESVLNKHGAVRECVVKGEPYEGLTRLVGYVVLNDDFKPSEALINELKTFSKQHCSKHEYPHFIKFIQAIPRTATGKMKRFMVGKQQEASDSIQ